MPIGGFSSGAVGSRWYVVDIHLHLPEVLVRQLPDLEVQKDEGTCESVVEHEVDEEMLAVERDPLLPAHEGEALAQLEEELLELGDQGPFQVGFAESLVLTDPGELE